MKIDEQFEQTIYKIVGEYGESSAVSQKIIAWIENIADGSENVFDRNSYRRFLDLIYSNMEIDGENLNEY